MHGVELNDDNAAAWRKNEIPAVDLSANVKPIKYKKITITKISALKKATQMKENEEKPEKRMKAKIKANKCNENKENEENKNTDTSIIDLCNSSDSIIEEMSF